MNKKQLISAVVSSMVILSGCAAESTDTGTAENKTAAPDDAERNIAVLSQSITDTSFTVVWSVGNDAERTTDYLLTIQHGMQQEQVKASQNVSAASSYVNTFYDQGTGDLKEAGKVVESAQKILEHSYVLKDLEPETKYTVTVQAVYADNSTSEKQSVNVTTASSDDTKIINIQSYGAIGDGQQADDDGGTASSGTLNTAAIQKAIDACEENGTVLIPSGKTFLCGPIKLKSNMTLDVEGTLLATADASQYSNVYDQDSSKTGQKSAAFISTDDSDACENIRIVGNGTIDGNGWCRTSSENTFEAFASGKASDVSKTAKNHLAAAQTARYSKQGESKSYACRSNLLSLSNINHLYLGDGITFTNPSMHTVSISSCQNTVVNNAVFSTYNCNNGDGIDYSGSTSDFTVVNSVFNTGDDCVCFAASKAVTGHAWIFNNYFGRGHGLIALGSNTNEGIEEVTAEDNVANGTAAGLRGKSQEGNGGGAWNIVFRNTAMADITDNDGIPFLLTNNYSAASKTGDNGSPCFHDISISDCTVNGSKKAFISMTGTQGDPAGTDYNISMVNVAYAYNKACASSSSANTSVLKDLKDSTFKNIRIYGVEQKWNLEEDSLSDVQVDQ